MGLKTCLDALLYIVEDLQQGGLWDLLNVGGDCCLQLSSAVYSSAQQLLGHTVYVPCTLPIYNSACCPQRVFKSVVRFSVQTATFPYAALTD
jgi:hypothetical protein